MSASAFTSYAPAGPATGVIRATGAGLRLVAAAGLAGVITFSLFMVMQALIAFDAQPEEAVETPAITISFDVPELEPTGRQPRIDHVDPILAPPPRPVITTEREALPIETNNTVATPQIENDAVMDGVSDLVLAPPPLDTRVEPVYPPREAARGVQGDCTGRYDILASGRTANLSVLGCDSRGFERASLEAVARWRHAAVRGQDPNAVVRRGVTTTLAYRLQD